jgi:Flp pilus assembly pilin Flp
MYLSRFAHSEHGSTHIMYSLIVGMISVAALLAAYIIDRQIKNRDGLAYATAARLVGETNSSKSTSSSGTITLHQVTVDYEPTGSTPTNLLAGKVILDPCTGVQKK